MARKKHKTPKRLDYLFDRKVIGKKQYRDFWDGYWKEERSRDREKYVNTFVSDLQLSLPASRRNSGTLTISVNEAKRQAEEIGGIVVRRNKAGRFSKSGATYQAIKKGGKRGKSN